MIIAGPQVHVTPELVGVAPNDQQCLAVRFQADDAVNDVGACFLEPPRPLNIGRFIETRAQFYNCRDLLAGIGRVNQRLDDRRVTAGTIKRDLHGKHLRIARRLFDKVDNRLKTVVGMMEEHIS